MEKEINVNGTKMMINIREDFYCSTPKDNKCAQQVIDTLAGHTIDEAMNILSIAHLMLTEIKKNSTIKITI